jgi:hypothetical protein
MRDGEWSRAREEGRMIVVGPSPLPAAEQEERWSRHLRELEDRRAEFAQAKAAAHAGLSRCDAFDLLAAVQIASTRDLPRAKEPDLHQVPAGAELLALFLIERGSRRPTRAGGISDEDFVVALERFGLISKTLLMITPDLLAPAPVPADRSAEGALNQIRNQMITHRLLLPLGETEALANESTVDLFGHPLVRSHLERELRMDASAAIALTDGIAELTVEGFLATVGDPSLRGWSGHGERLSFTVDELADAAGVELEQAESFAERFSLRFDGSVLGYGELTTRARRRPLLRDGERLMPISIPVLRRSLRGSMTALLNPDVPAAGPGDKAAFEAFKAERGEWLERKAMAVLKGALRPRWQQLNVHFQLEDGRRGEIDGLLELGGALLVVQAKSGVNRIDTEASNPERFRKSLVELLGGENLRQHRLGREAVSEAGARLSLDQAGTAVFRPDLAGVRRVLSLHVTLENLAGVGAQPWHLQTAGISEDRDLPWIVGIGHLPLLLEYFELPALFLHFLTRRLRANRTGQLLAMDEVDWAVRYGEDQLRWAELSPGHPGTARGFTVLDEHEAFDEWVLARERGGRAKKPRPRLAGALWRLLGALDRARPQGWLDFSLAVLDLPDDGRREVAKLWQRQLRSDRRLQSMPYHVVFGSEGEASIGFTTMREEKRRHPLGHVVLEKVCREKMEEVGAPRWVGIVAPFDPEGAVPWCCALDEGELRRG